MAIKLSCILLLFFLLPGLLFAEDFLTDDTIRIARHDKRRSSVLFQRNKNVATMDRWGTLFEPDAARRKKLFDSRLVSYSELPNCAEPDVRLREVYQHTMITDYFDVLYYSAESSEQRKRAAQYKGRTVAYQPALVKDRKTNQPDNWQYFARFIGIECLPTRFRFTYVGSQRYKEFRLGESAWNLDK